MLLKKLTLYRVSFFIHTLLILTMDTQDLRLSLLDRFDNLDKDYVINSIIKLLPESQLKEIEDSLDRDIF